MSLSEHFSPLGLGTSIAASVGNRISDADAALLFKEALNNNVRVIDTADTYGSGDSERMIGKAIKGKRDEFFIVTKAGFPYVALPGFLSPLNQFGKKMYQKLGLKNNYAQDYLVKSVKKSLRRLGTDHVDTFFLHEPSNQDLVSSDDFWNGLQQIKKEGLAKNVGIATSDVGAFNLAFSAGVVDMAETSLPYNNDIPSVFAACKKHNIPVIVNQIMRVRTPVSVNEKALKELEAIGLSARDIPSVLIAYALKYKKADCVLIGTKNPSHLKENAKAPFINADMERVFNEIAKMTL